MSLKLSDILKTQQSMRMRRESSIKEQSKVYAEMLQTKADAKKREKELEEQRLQREREEEEQRELVRLQLERERKTKRYFTFNKYSRRVAAPRKPVYYGEMEHRSVSWMPHGRGQYLIDDGKVKMEGIFQRGDLINGLVNYADGVTWEGPMKNDMMDGVGTLLLPTDWNNTQTDEVEPLDESADSDYDEEEAQQKKEAQWEQRMRERVKRHAIVRENQVVCFRDELVNGKRVVFLGSMFGIYPQLNNSRSLTATIVSHVKDWTFLCRFDEETWPRDRNIDFAVHRNFYLSNKSPNIYTLPGFGIETETRRVYDYRHRDTTDRRVIRNTAENALKLQQESADEWEIRKENNTLKRAASIDLNGSFSFDSRSEIRDHGVINRNGDRGIGFAPSESLDRSFVSFNPNIDKKSLDSNQFVSRGIQNDNISIRSTGTATTGTAAGNSTNGGVYFKLGAYSADTAATNDSSATYTGNFHSYHDAAAMRRRRLLQNFPTRQHEDRAVSFFEGEAIGIGAAAAEQTKALQQELKKQQFQELIEERKKIQETQRQKQIEVEQQRMLSESLSLKRQSDKVKRDEEATFEEEKRKAIAAVTARLDSR